MVIMLLAAVNLVIWALLVVVGVAALGLVQWGAI